MALFCLLADFVLYNNLFDVVELICSDLHATLEKERGNLSKLGKERSKLKEQIKELSDRRMSSRHASGACMPQSADI